MVRSPNGAAVFRDGDWHEYPMATKPGTAAREALVLSGCLRVLTHPRIFDPPTPLPRAIETGSTSITTDRDDTRF